MNFTGYKCDGCGRIKGEANHWYIVRVEEHPVEVAGHLDLRLSACVIFEWTPALAKLEDSYHYCGSACLQKKLGEFVK